MRYIVIGAGAVGGSIGARLFEAGHRVVLVARGAQLKALVSDGLTFASPAGTRTLPIPAVAGPQELTLEPDDVLLLAVKLQDSAEALDLWSGQPVAGGRTAGQDLPLLCIQNGVEGERLALRRFARVYGVCVVLPATFLEPGAVAAAGDPLTGVLALGCYPNGSDETCQRVSVDFEAAGLGAPVSDDVMRWKYTKLLSNLGNAVQAILGHAQGAAEKEIYRRATAEGEAILVAAEIGRASDEEDRAMRARLVMGEIPGAAQSGGSTWQSLQRGSRSVEADFLAGEIVLLGRLHGVPTPVNETLQRVVNDCARKGLAPGTIDVTELAKLIDEADAS